MGGEKKNVRNYRLSGDNLDGIVRIARDLCQTKPAVLILWCGTSSLYTKAQTDFCKFK